MKIGIIGAENSHTAAIAALLNVEKKIKGCRVEYVWGETDEFARQAAGAGQIPNIVKHPKEMLGKIDAVIVDHRHPKYHLKAVWPFVERGIPAFVDKPFCYRAEEGKAFLKMARTKGTPVTSFSALPHYDSFRQFKKKAAKLGRIVSAYSHGPCDLKSKWGGVFFYGVHQVEVMLHAFGYDVHAVLVSKQGPNATAQLFYPSGLIAAMALIKEGSPGFGICAVGEKGSVAMPLTSGKNPYFNGARIFTTMFRTGVEPMRHQQLLKPVQILEAMEKSLRSGRIERVAK